MTDQLIEVSQDFHSRVHLTYLHTDKIYSEDDTELLKGSWVSGYVTQLDPNYIDNMDFWTAYSCALAFNIVTICAMFLIAIAAFITYGAFSLAPALLILYFIQQIYFSQMASIEYPRFYTEFLSWLYFSSFELQTFPHIISENIFDADKTKEGIYPLRFKRVGLYHNSSIINSECKIEIIVFWFLFLFPFSIIL